MHSIYLFAFTPAYHFITTLAIRSALLVTVGRSLKSPDQVHVEKMNPICFVVPFQFAGKGASVLIYLGVSVIKICVGRRECK